MFTPRIVDEEKFSRIHETEQVASAKIFATSSSLEKEPTEPADAKSLTPGVTEAQRKRPTDTNTLATACIVRFVPSTTRSPVSGRTTSSAWRTWLSSVVLSSGGSATANRITWLCRGRPTERGTRAYSIGVLLCRGWSC